MNQPLEPSLGRLLGCFFAGSKLRQGTGENRVKLGFQRLDREFRWIVLYAP
jgi:hypothetical protein